MTDFVWAVVVMFAFTLPVGLGVSGLLRHRHSWRYTMALDPTPDALQRQDTTLVRRCSACDELHFERVRVFYPINRSPEKDLPPAPHHGRALPARPSHGPSESEGNAGTLERQGSMPSDARQTAPSIASSSTEPRCLAEVLNLRMIEPMQQG